MKRPSKTAYVISALLVLIGAIASYVYKMYWLTAVLCTFYGYYVAKIVGDND